MRKEKCECEETVINGDPKSTLSLAEQYRIGTAKMLLSKMGYIEMASGSWVRPEDLPKANRKKE